MIWRRNHTLPVQGHSFHRILRSTYLVNIQTSMTVLKDSLLKSYAKLVYEWCLDCNCQSNYWQQSPYFYQTGYLRNFVKLMVLGQGHAHQFPLESFLYRLLSNVYFFQWAVVWSFFFILFSCRIILSLICNLIINCWLLNNRLIQIKEGS